MIDYNKLLLKHKALKQMYQNVPKLLWSMIQFSC